MFMCVDPKLVNFLFCVRGGYPLLGEFVSYLDSVSDPFICGCGCTEVPIGALPAFFDFVVGKGIAYAHVDQAVTGVEPCSDLLAGGRRGRYIGA